MLTPGPLVFDRTFSSQVFKFFNILHVFKSSHIFKSKGRLCHEQKVNKVLVQQKWAIKTILMLTPGPLVQQKVDRTFSSQKAIVVVIMSTKGQA